MSKRLNELGISADMKIDTKKIINGANAALNSVSEERKIFMKHRIIKRAAIAAALTLLFSASVFAMTPAGQETINSIILYFQNDSAREITDVEELTKYGQEIGESVTKDGYTLTLNSVAADDNFIHMFYTLKSEDKPFYEASELLTPYQAEAAAHRDLYVECLIDGMRIECKSNNEKYDSYFVDNYTYKAAYKYNIAQDNINEKFKIELFAERYPEGNPLIHRLVTEGRGLTEEEKASVWYVSADVDISKARVESVTKELNVSLPWVGKDGRAEKAVFSPFGNQLVITTGAAEYMPLINNFALYDENGVCLDILNTDLRYNEGNSSRNSIEFLKADKNTEQLTFVPIEYTDSAQNSIEYEIGAYPITYKLSDYGSVVVTDIRIADGLVEIDYYKDGFVMYDPGFVLTNADGENAEPGGKLGCVLYNDVHYAANSYTARYVYDARSENGKPIPSDESVSAETIKSKFTILGVSEQRNFKLDYDNAVTVDLK